MKKITTYISCLLLGASLSACSDFLDKEVDLTLSEEQVFSSYENTRGFLANVYNYLPDAFVGYTDTQYRSASRDCMTDNSLGWWSVLYYGSVLNDGYSSETHPFALDFWSRDSDAIRAANQFLKNAREDVIGNYDRVGDDNHLYDRYMAEARLLRAIFHFDMSAWFGPIPYMGDDENGEPIIFEQNDPRMNQARMSCADIMKWVADECDKVKDVLPFRYSNEAENWGRVNGAAAYALKSRALLYRASALNNPDNNQEWWREAAQAAADFFTANNRQPLPYKLYRTEDNDYNENYYQCFVASPYTNDEYILTRLVWNVHTIEDFLTPCGFTGTINSSGRTNPTQNLVDSYEMANGLPIDDPNSGYDEQNPYANRDPRLEQTILHHGSLWGDRLSGEERAVDVSPGGVDYENQNGGTLTGYYTKKYLNRMSFENPQNFQHVCPIFRYGEVLLNAAEAYNEIGETTTAMEYVNELRSRVGMPAYSGMSQSQLRERIRNERRIELCFEDHRWFDERRWKLFEGRTADNERNLPRYQQVYNIYGVTVNPESTTNMYTYGTARRYPVRTFISPKNYLLPIPDSEVRKLPELKQNPGWELSY